MKKVINSKRYNTKTATEIANWYSGHSRMDANYCDESLFRTKNGLYFLLGSGGAFSKYAERSGSGWTASEDIIAMTEDEAMKWLERTDNINALELGDLQNKATLEKGTANYNEVYSQLVSRVGSKTHELDVNREAQGILYEQAKAQRESVSGVNLDEEAADLVRYQQAYQANAKVISAASEMFDTLIGVLRR